MTTTLTNNLEKLTESRLLLRPFKRKPQWESVTASINGPMLTYTSEDSHAKTFHILPASARLCSYAEQLSKKRQHLFLLKTVPEHAQFDRDQSIFYFAATTKDIAESWVHTANKHSLDAALPDWTPLDVPIIAAWGHVPRIPAKGVPDVLKRLHFKLSMQKFALSFHDVCARPLEKKIHIREFIDVIFHLVKAGPVISAMMQDAGPDGLTADQLATAIMCTPEQASTLLAQHSVQHCSQRLLLQLLFDQSNSIIDAEKAAASHDMTQPLNNYLISSSHNTYLTGDQLQSESTAEMYRFVLEKGCRCVEIDMWDGDDGVPIVTHGHTMTSAEPLEHVIGVIAEHSFTHGYEYPVILSLENHLSHEQQVKAANMMKSVLGDMLLLRDSEDEEQDTLPSPESMKGKILIKAKTGRSVLRSEMGKSTMSLLSEAAGLEDEDSDEEESSDMGDSGQHSRLSLKRITKRRGSTDKDPTDSTASPPAGKPKSNKIVPEIADLVFLSGGNRKSLMALWKQGISGKAQYLAASCVSLSEKKIDEVLENNLFEQIREYNSHGLTRVYPKGTRVDSSNYTPTLAYFLGCQLVALNWQGEDGGLAINEARFLCNGGTGYVLSKSVLEPALPGTLEFEFLSGFLLPTGEGKAKGSVKRDIIDSYCALKLYDQTFGDSDDSCSFKFETTVARSNGFAPVWQQSVQIPIKNRALSVINIKVYDHDRTSEDDFLGYCPVPVSLLREGIRSCPLNSKEGEPFTLPGTTLRPSILCKVKWV